MFFGYKNAPLVQGDYPPQGDGLSSPWGGVVARYTRRILTAKKHAHTKSIVVLKNTIQNEAYMTPIQYIREKGSNSSDFPSRIDSNTWGKCANSSIRRERHCGRVRPRHVLSGLEHLLPCVLVPVISRYGASRQREIILRRWI